MLFKNIEVILILLFFCITYLISALEKITDWKGTISFTKAHFKASPLKNYTALLLGVILIIELVAVVYMVIGGFNIYYNSTTEFASIGLSLSAVTLLCLLVGQRLAKDYAGASSITIYFILNVLGLYFINN